MRPSQLETSAGNVIWSCLTLRNKGYWLSLVICLGSWTKSAVSVSLTKLHYGLCYAHRLKPVGSVEAICRSKAIVIWQLAAHQLLQGHYNSPQVDHPVRFGRIWQEPQFVDFPDQAHTRKICHHLTM